MHDISILYQIIFTFRCQFAGCTALCFTAQRHEIFVFDHLGANEAAFEIRMDNAGALRCLIAGLERPGVYLIATCREEGA